MARSGSRSLQAISLFLNVAFPGENERGGKEKDSIDQRCEKDVVAVHLHIWNKAEAPDRVLLVSEHSSHDVQVGTEQVSRDLEPDVAPGQAKDQHHHEYQEVIYREPDQRAAEATGERAEEHTDSGRHEDGDDQAHADAEHIEAEIVPDVCRKAGQGAEAASDNLDLDGCD